MQLFSPKVSIILLNYNGFEDTINCFQSIQKISYDNYDVILVDNASTDASINKIMTYLQDNNAEHVFFKTPEIAMDNIMPKPKISLIQSLFNGGYGHGNNIGIKYALKNDAQYILVLNNDTIVDSGFVEPMVKICEEDKRVGIASGKIHFYNKPDVIWFNGGKFSPCTAKVEHFNFNEKDVGQVPREAVTFISGCLWLIPRKVFRDVGFIYEEYFMYMEDVEFCQRVLTKGYKLKIAKDSNILHKVGGSYSGQLSSFSVYYRSKNKVSFILEKLNYRCKAQALFSLIFLESLRYIYIKRLDLFKSHTKGIVFGFIRK